MCSSFVRHHEALVSGIPAGPTVDRRSGDPDPGHRVEPVMEAGRASGSASRLAGMPCGGSAAPRVDLATLLSHAAAHPVPGSRAKVRAAFAADAAELTFDAVADHVGSRVAARWAVLQLVGSGELALGAAGPLVGRMPLRRVPAGRSA